MDIVGIGTHLVECARVVKLLARHADLFLAQVYTPAEQAFCRNRTHSTEHYAAIWAAKQAVYRALGTTWHKRLSWTDVSVATPDMLSLTATLSGLAKGFADGQGVSRVLVTCAHTRAFATATAIAIRN